MEEFLLYGSGGHAKVVLECLKSRHKRINGLFDDNVELKFFKEYIVLGSYDPHIHPEAFLLITIGNNEIRKKVSEKIRHAYGTAVHNSVIISESVIIGAGNMVLPGAVLNADSRTGKHVIINTKAVAEHDCVIGDFVHLAPGSVVCGNAQIGEGTLVGANAVIAPNVKVGKWCRISAGSSVLEDVPDYALISGVPGTVIKSLN